MMGKNSGIQWHDDYPKKWHYDGNLKNIQNYWGIRSDWKYAASLYLNHRWDDTWGGELMYTDSKTRGYIPIVGNSLVLMRTPLQHKVNTVLSPVLPRLSIQMFLRR
jgi:predicted 2-oxoglutarate/Fe(II)-dependent dioxygenase YbiX